MADELRAHGTLRETLRTLGKNGGMRVVLVEPSASGRRSLSAWLSDLGIQVAPFGDPHIAFLFLLGRLDEVDGVLVNGDDQPRGSRLLRRLEMLPAPVAVVTYSGPDVGHAAATIAIAGREPIRSAGIEAPRLEEPAGY